MRTTRLELACPALACGVVAPMASLASAISSRIASVAASRGGGGGASGGGGAGDGTVEEASMRTTRLELACPALACGVVAPMASLASAISSRIASVAASRLRSAARASAASAPATARAAAASAATVCERKASIAVSSDAAAAAAGAVAPSSGLASFGASSASRLGSDGLFLIDARGGVQQAAAAVACAAASEAANGCSSSATTEPASDIDMRMSLIRLEDCADAMLGRSDSASDELGRRCAPSLSSGACHATLHEADATRASTGGGAAAAANISATHASSFLRCIAALMPASSRSAESAKARHAPSTGKAANASTYLPSPSRSSSAPTCATLISRSCVVGDALLVAASPPCSMSSGGCSSSACGGEDGSSACSC